MMIKSLIYKINFWNQVFEFQLYKIIISSPKIHVNIPPVHESIG